jgi:FixJ family two-component response regulator
MKESKKIVMMLDDDHAILNSLEQLLTDHGYRVMPYDNPEDFFRGGLPDGPACLLLDNQLANGKTGVEVHQELQSRGWHLPTVFLTAHWNVSSVVAAMRAGADGFLAKPFEPADLLQAVDVALDHALQYQQEQAKSNDARARVASLTPREAEVVSMVVGGQLNKQIADKLGLSLVTVKVHRGRAMAKLGAGNPAEMAKIASLGGLI